MGHKAVQVNHLSINLKLDRVVGFRCNLERELLKDEEMHKFIVIELTGLRVKAPLI